MHELVRGLIEGREVWGARDGQVAHEPPELQDDYAARLIALLVEKAGGRVEFGPEEIMDVVDRLILVPSSVEPAGAEPPGLILEVRRLASN